VAGCAEKHWSTIPRTSSDSSSSYAEGERESRALIAEDGFPPPYLTGLQGAHDQARQESTDSTSQLRPGPSFVDGLSV
jgi:hypothetical protein